MSLKILCVEDEVSLLSDMTEELTAAGYEVLPAADVSTAISLLTQHRPALILCDVMLPGGYDGYDLHQYVRQQRADLDSIPFLFLTALGHRDAVLKGHREGVDDYLIKPIDYDLLLATIASRLAQFKRLNQGQDNQHAVLRGGLQELFTHLPGAVLLCDEQGVLLFANAPADRLAQEQDVWRRAPDGTVTWPKLRADSRIALREWFAKACDSDTSALQRLALEHSSDQSVILASLVRLDVPARLGDSDKEACLAIFLASAQMGSLPSEDALRMMYSLTPTEAKVALLLAQGLRPEAIAELLQVSASGVAFHLRNIYAKTGRARQADVVALVLSAGWMLHEKAP